MKRRGSFNGVVVGLDLSLRGTAACALPCPWDFDLAKVRMVKLGRHLTKDATLEDRYSRTAEIADGVLAFCKEVQARKVFVEDHAFGQSTNQAYQTVEMTGVVKNRIYEDWGISTVPIVASRARKIMLQKLPKKDVKKFTMRNVARLGEIATTWTEDERDAFVCANAGLMIVGGVALTFLGE